MGPAETRPAVELGQAGYEVSRTTAYLLRPADRISVSVFREPDFSLGDVQVGPDGRVSLPLVGAVEAEGRTVAELEQDVTRRLDAAGLRNPQVSVNIREYASHLVTVDGAVTQPGVYPFQPGARLTSALALARGLARTADRREVAVFRQGADGLTVAKFDYDLINQGRMLDPVLQPGDRVVIGSDSLSVAWQDFLRALPVFGIFANPANF